MGPGTGQWARPSIHSKMCFIQRAKTVVRDKLFSFKIEILCLIRNKKHFVIMALKIVKSDKGWTKIILNTMLFICKLFEARKKTEICTKVQTSAKHAKNSFYIWIRLSKYNKENLWQREKEYSLIDKIVKCQKKEKVCLLCHNKESSWLYK